MRGWLALAAVGTALGALSATAAVGLVVAAGAILLSMGERPETGVSPPDGHRVLLVVHSEWNAGAAIATRSFDRACPDGGDLQQAELAAVRASLARLGLEAEVVDALRGDESAALILHHNGGWGSHLDPGERSALARLHERGVPILLAGDDAAWMVRAEPEIRRWLGLEWVSDNGSYPVDVDAAGQRVAYAKDPDVVRTLPGADVRVTFGARPAAWLAPAGEGGPAGVFDLGLRASDVCPVAPDGEAALEEVFRAMVSDLVYER